MIKKIAMTASLITCLAGSSLANATDVCLNINGNAGQLMFGDCISVWNTLSTSGKFPTIFSKQPPALHPGLCFVTGPGGIPATLGSTTVSVSAASAWTTEFSPYLPPFVNGPDNLGSVISKLTIKDVNRNRILGDIYTVDSVDTSAFNPSVFDPSVDSTIDLNEQDVVISGNNKLAGAKGSVRINSSLDLTTGLVTVTEIKGRLCIPQ
jgi:hypothetical protein